MTGRTDATMLAGLIHQAEGEGAARVTLRALAEEASEQGAERALQRLGLADGTAAKDIGELRDLLGYWRDARRAAGRAAMGWLVRIVLALLLMGMAAKSGLVARWLP